MKRARLCAAALLCALAIITLAPSSATAETTIQISPPPLGFCDYANEKSQKQVEGTFANISNDDNMDIVSLGATFKAMGVGKGGKGAMHFAIGGGVIGGEVVENDVTGINLNLSLTPALCLSDPKASIRPVVFAGGLMSVQSMEIAMSGPNTKDTTMTMSSYGFQGGLQLMMGRDDVVIAPYFLMQSMSGTSSVDNGTTTSDSDFDYDAKALGIDILFVKSGITLSSMVQALTQEDDDTDMIIIQFGKKY